MKAIMSVVVRSKRRTRKEKGQFINSGKKGFNMIEYYTFQKYDGVQFFFSQTLSRSSL